jgi:hypothetical protein
MIWRTKLQAMVQGRGSTQRIQFASNESKLVPRNLNPGPHLSWAFEEWTYF